MKRWIVTICLYIFCVYSLYAQTAHHIDFGVEYPNAWVNKYYKSFDWTGNLTSGMYTANPTVKDGFFIVDIYVERTTDWPSEYRGHTATSSKPCSGRGKINYNNTLGGFTVVIEGTFGDRFDPLGSSFVLSPNIAKETLLPQTDCRYEDGADYAVSPSRENLIALDGYSVLTITYVANTSPGNLKVADYIELPLNKPFLLGTLKLKITDITKKTDFALSAIDCFGQVFSTNSSETGYGARYKRVGWLDVDPNGIPLGPVEVLPSKPEINNTVGKDQLCTSGNEVFKLTSHPQNADTVIWYISSAAKLPVVPITDAKVVAGYAKGDSVKIAFYKTGLYYINAYSKGGGKKSDTVTYLKTIQVLEAPVLTLNSNKSNVCSADPVKLTANSVGISDGGYIWTDNSMITTALRTVNPLITTTYSVTVANGTCRTTKNIEVQVTPLPVVVLNPTGSLISKCEGDSIIIRASGATTYQWTWSGGSATGEVLRQKPTANLSYSVIGTSADGCKSVAVKKDVEITIRPVISWVTKPPKLVNVNDPITVEATVKTSLNSPMYYWLKPDGVSGYDLKRRTIATAKPHDYHFWVYAEDPNNCLSDTLRDTTKVFVPQVQVEADSMYAFCTGGADLLKAKVIAGISKSPYQYEWIRSGQTTVLGRDSILYVTAAGDYVVKVTDNSPTPLTGFDTIHLRAQKTINITLNADSPMKIKGGSRTLLAVEASGDTPTSWHWGPLNGFDTSVETLKHYPQTAVLNQTKKYGVYVMDASGCMSQTDSVEVIVDNTNGIQLIAEANTKTTCKKGDIQLNAKIIGGSGTSTYSWTPSTGLTPASSVQNPVFSSAVAGKYTFRVKVTKGTGVAIDSITVEVKDLEAPVLALTKDKNCVGDTIKLTNSGASGEIKWFKKGIVVPGATNKWLEISTTGTYSATVLTAQRCQDTVKMDISPDLQPTLIWNPTLAAKVENGTLIAPKVKASSGTPSYTITWTSPTTVVGSDYLPTITANYADVKYDFAVSAVDSKGCKSNKLEQTVTVVPPSLKVNIDSAYRYCQGGAELLRLLTPVTGGTLPYYYKWYVSGTPADIKHQGADAIEYAFNCTNDDIDIVLEVSDNSSTKIFGYDTVRLSTKYLKAPLITAGADQTVRSSATAILLGSATRGTPTVWNWSPESQLVAGEKNKQYAKTTPRIVSQTYTLFVTDANNCRSVNANTDVNVDDQNGLLVVVTPSDATICLKNTIKLNASAIGAVNYKWLPVPGADVEPGELDNDQIANPIFTPKSPGIKKYVVEVADAAGRKATAMVSITVNNASAPVLKFAATKSCEGDTITVQNSGGSIIPNSYIWYLDGIVQSATKGSQYIITQTGAHTIKVTATSTGACTADTISTTATIYERPLLSMWDVTPPATVELNKTLSATVAEATKGKSPYSYSWLSPTSGTATGKNYLINNTQDVGSYQFKVCAQDANNCHSIPLEATTVIQGSKLIVKAEIVGNPTVCWGSVAEVRKKSVEGGNGNYEYKWYAKGVPTILAVSESYTIPTFELSTPTEYVLEVKETSGNRMGYDTVSFTVIGAQAPTIAHHLTAVDTCGEGKVTIDALNAGNYDWHIVTGTGVVNTDKKSYRITSLGDYKVYVTISGVGSGGASCTVKDSLSGVIYERPSVSVTPKDVVVAEGEKVTMTAVSDANKYNISWENTANISAISSPLSIVSVPIQNDLQFVITAANKLVRGCKATDTVKIYMLPKPPVLAIDTNTNRYTIKLHWAYDNFVDSVRIYSTLWDAYNILGGGYKLEKSIVTAKMTDTLWVEPNMTDTLKFYYAKSVRNIAGKGSYLSKTTSDTMGWYRVDLNVNPENSSDNYFTAYFNFAQMGLPDTKALFTYLNKQVSTIFHFVYSTQSLVSSRLLGSGAALPNYTIQQGEVLVFKSKIKTQFLQYGKLPSMYSMNSTNTNKDIPNKNTIHILMQKIDFSMAKDIFGEIPARYIFRWDFTTQGWKSAFMAGTNCMGNFSLMPLMPIQVQLNNGILNFEWK